MKRSTTELSKHFRTQRGGALVVTLLLLLVMTLIGVTGMQVTSLEEKMTGNMRDRNLAFQAAESALRAGEEFLTTATLSTFSGNTEGLYKFTSLTTPWWQGIDWSDSDAVITYTPTDGAKLADVAANPAYIIEELPSVPKAGESLEAGTPADINYYRVTARGTGGTSTAIVMLQSIYKR